MARPLLCALAVAAAVLAAGAAADLRFQANVKITDSPKYPNAVVEAVMYYKDTPTSKMRRMDYTAPSTLKEIIDYTNQVRYKVCSSCEALIFGEPFDLLYKQSSDGEPEPEGSCTWYTRANSEIVRIAVQTTGAGYPCAVLFADGTKMTFSQQKALSGDSAFALPTNPACPQPVCRAVIDMVLNVDVSASINSTDWPKATTFINNFVGLLEMNPEEVAVGMVIFSYASSSKKLIDITTDRASFKRQLSNYVRPNNLYGTCIGCGLSISLNMLNAANSRKDLNPAKVIVTITDGANNEPTPKDTTGKTNFTNSAANVHAAEITSFAVGVGDAEAAELVKIATTPKSGEQTVFQVSDYSQLGTILGKIIAKTCTHNKVVGGDCKNTCNGFCGCGETCVCPTCDALAGNKCFTSECNPAAPTAGCQLKATQTCTPTDTCHTAACDPLSGCVNTPIAIPDNFPALAECAHYVCPSTGSWDQNSIGYDETACTTGNKCVNMYCDPVSGCQSEDVVCAKVTCKKSECDPAIGCVYEDLCQAQDLCSVASCTNDECTEVPTNCHSDRCTTRTCNPLTGACKMEAKPCSTQPCKTVKCNPDAASDEERCEYTAIEGCSLCGLDPCPEEHCKTATCSEAPGAIERTCTYELTEPPKEHCVVHTCNLATGKFDPTPEEPTADFLATRTEADMCSTATCDTQTGNWYWKPDCKSASACAYQECVLDVETYKCVDRRAEDVLGCKAGERAPVSAGYEPCTIFTGGCLEPTVANAGVPTAPTGATCKTEKLSCLRDTSLPPCILNTFCDTDTDPNGVCGYTQRDCQAKGDDGNPCLTYECSNSVVGGCTSKPKVSTNTDKCLVPGECDAATGEIPLVPKCPQDSACAEHVCRIDTKSSTASCVHVPIECTIKDPQLAACFVSHCSEEEGRCVVEIGETAAFDNCGNCIAFADADIPESVDLEDYQAECTAGMPFPKLVTAITGGALAGIILAGIIGLIVLGVSGYFGTKEMLRRAKAAKNQGAVNNPLYESSASEGVNPLFAGEEASAL